MTAMDYIVEVCRLYVLIALLFAALGKTRGLAEFRRSLAESFPVLAGVDAMAAFAIVSTEWGIAVSMLAGGPAARLGIFAALALFIFFTAVIGWSLANGRAIVCSCFGASGRRIGPIDFARNLALTAAAAWVAFWTPTGSGLALLGQLTLAGIATILVLGSIWLRDLIWLLRAKPGQ
jgi:Methylamine utilisation protein MauE